MKIRIASFVILSLFIFAAAALSAQSTSLGTNATEAVEEEEARTAPQRLGEYLKPGTNPNWMDFRPGFTVNPQQIFSQYAADFGLTENDEMTFTRSTTDPLGNMHYRFQQFNKGAKVMGGEFIVHVNTAGEVYAANGRLARNLDRNASPQKSEGAAVAAARASVPGVTFVPPHWHPTPDEPAFNNPNFMQHGHLVWVNPDNASPEDVQALRLAWMVEVYEQTGTQNKALYIDAANGEVLRTDQISMGCDYATGTTTWHGNQLAYTDEFSPGNYHLEYDCASFGGGGIRTYNNNLSGAIITDYWDGDNTWNSYNDQAGYTTHFSTRQVNRYFFTEHGRENFDDAGGDLTMYTNCSFVNSSGDTYYTNAFYSGGGVCRFGAGSAAYNPNDDLNTLDIVGHEITHGIVDFAADLVYADESGALNESFADIFGETVEMWFEGGTTEWLVGEDWNAIRSFQDPGAYGDPDTYQGSNWYVGSDDNGGVHTNSGVQNYWFYLLSEGGSDVNDNGVPYDVSGIGYDNAAAIAYGNLTNYLISSSDYTDAREGAIRASNDLFGLCSFQTRQTAQAWRACGVGPELVNWDAEASCGFNYTPWLVDYVVTGIETLTAGGPGCTVTASPGLAGLSVVFRAGEQVQLLPGFRTNPGANFYTLLDPCAATGYRLSASDASEEVTPEAAEAASEEVLTAAKPSMTVQPNPFTDRTTVQIDPALLIETADLVGGMTLMVFDQTGKLVREIHSASPSGLLDGPIVVELSDQPAGVYLCRAEVDGKLVASEKLIKVE